MSPGHFLDLNPFECISLYSYTLFKTMNISRIASVDELYTLCDRLTAQDTDLAGIIREHGYPPYWDRPNSFETLVHIILEQQVSLASARAALEKLRSRLGVITPENFLQINDDEFTGLYISRQKKGYLQGLACELAAETLDLSVLALLPDELVRERLIQLKGIGDWTIDIYLIMVLHRLDIFPIGDVAARTALKKLKGLPTSTSLADLQNAIHSWQPYRSVGTILLWHYYLSLKSHAYP